MKKVLSAVAALVLCFAMTTTAFAASPVTKVSVETKGVEVAEVKTDDVKTIENNFKKDAGSDKAELVAYFDLSSTTVKAGEDVTVAIAGIKASETYVVLHYAATGVEKLAATAVDGKITFKAPATWSPFAVVKVEAAATSPKTGETAPVAAMAVVLLAAAGIVVLNKKKLA